MSGDVNRERPVKACPTSAHETIKINERDVAAGWTKQTTGLPNRMSSVETASQRLYFVTLTEADPESGVVSLSVAVAVIV